MKCVNGIWYHRSQIYATLHEALVAVWPRELPRAGGKNKPLPVLRIPGAAERNRFDTTLFPPPVYTETGGIVKYEH